MAAPPITAINAPVVIVLTGLSAPATARISEAPSYVPPTGVMEVTPPGEAAEVALIGGVTIAVDDGVSEGVVSASLVTSSAIASGEITSGFAAAGSWAALPAAGTSRAKVAASS
ncbi:hypothetical protein [Pseudarthrobacter sp. S6]|uniref:hypothetical protein n=1 Tax=Pseudarthrobacter sp. S6 TaxID=3418420 RepID=UPI003CF16F28